MDDNGHTTQMKAAAQLIASWADEMVTMVERLRAAADLLEEAGGDMRAASVLAREYLMLAVLDTAFLVELFKRLDEGMIVTALRGAGKAAQGRFRGALGFLDENQIS